MKIHGGKVFEAAAKLGLDWSDIIDFSANINPLGQPVGLRDALFAEFDRTLHYPQIDAGSLKALISKIYNLPPSCILPGAGSTPHLYLLCRSLGLAKAVIIGPAFAEYEAALNCAGIKPEYVLSRVEDDWRLTGETLERLWQTKPEAVFLANPANPTARLVPDNIIKSLADGCRQRDIWLVVDEAFIDFSSGALSLLQHVRHHDKLIVLRSLTKIYALPGLRLAFLAAHEKTVDLLSSKVEPWFLSSPAITAGHYCLSLTGFKQRTIETVTVLRNKLIDLLKESTLGYVFPSEANYVLMRLKSPETTQALVEHLFERKILVRDASSFVGLGKGYLRFAVRPEDELKALGKALSSFQDVIKYEEAQNA